MEAFRWDTYFETGLAAVDQQHFHLVGLINEFGRLLTQNKLQIEDTTHVFQELQAYAIYHFDEEETLMKKAGIDPRSLSQHIQVHRDFLLTVTEMHEQLSQGNPSTSKFLLTFLSNWLANHILGMDQNLSRQLAAIEDGSSAAQAFEAERIDLNGATKALLTTLDNLFQQVSESNKELQLLNQTLEMQVVQRTQALQKANKDLEQLAITDALTNLPNRRHAMLHLSALWEKAQQQNVPLSCLMIDADHFKQVNDNYGHDAGDQVLTALTKKLQETLRNDDIVCRLGGDEFLVICENTGFVGAMHAAQILCDTVAKMQVDIGKGTWLGSISIGVASKEDNMRDIDQLIKVADQGVYLAKAAGKNCVRSIYPANNKGAVDKLSSDKSA
ncbi:MAG: diguanylate cyclase (GGDEF)-like protein/hemerythrin-like metal-binding protein [Psychromonas sp.]|jgi:diguanylate cyclase (GGDEF)-like protein/hemerythrin-like metal-binding protein|uniref:GGDEF domain-containing protein n=1 Tax=Psychromonas sp. TaxID=1884585 RepID=UPI0039E35B7B